jgi:O-antigen/teichoic acid export membrane protein
MTSADGSLVPEASASVGAERAPAVGQIRGGMLLVGGQGIALALGFATQVLLVRYLTKGDYGAFAYALAVVLIAQTVCSLGLNRTVARWVSIYRVEGRVDRAAGAVVVAIGAMLAVGVAVVAGTYVLLRAVGHPPVHDPTARSLLLILIFAAPIQAVDDLLMSLFAVFDRLRAIFLRIYVVAPALRFAVVLVLVEAHKGVRFVTFGYVAASALGFVLFAFVLARVLRREQFLAAVERGAVPLPLRNLFGLSIPLLVADLTYILLTSMDAVLLGYYRGTDQVAAFRAVQPAAKLNEIVAAGFLILFTPAASRLFARTDLRGLRYLYLQTSIWIAVVTFPIFAVTFGLARPLTVLLFGGRYSSSGTLLAVLAVGFYVQMAVGFNGTVLLVTGKMKAVVVAGFVAVAVNLVLDLILIPRYGPIGAAIGTSVALVVHNALKQVAIRLSAGIPMLDRRYVRVYATIVVGAAAVALLERVLDLRFFVALPFALAASLLVVGLNRRSLSVAETFPELRRLPFARLVFGD